MKSPTPPDPTAEPLRPVVRKFSVIVQLADLQARHPRVRLTLPRLRRDQVPSRRALIDALRVAERGDWSPEAGNSPQS